TEGNAEGNRDGMNDDCSWNCGVEGPTADPDILRLRTRQAKNLLATLMLSQGVPMLMAGDEFLRTQHGNNNAWCQDNDLSWLDWRLADLSPKSGEQRTENTRQRTEDRGQRTEDRRQRTEDRGRGGEAAAESDTLLLARG